MFIYDKKCFDEFNECKTLINDIFLRLQDVIKLYGQVADTHSDEFDLFIKILEDNHNLLSEIVDDDINLYKFSLDNYNNPFLYQGYYYLTNISHKTIMSWERIFNCLGIIYGIEFNQKKEQNNISYIYKKLKKIDTFKNSVSCTIIKKFYGDNSFNLIKNMREVNDHDISEHLDVLNSIREDDILKDLYDIYDTADDSEKIQVKLDKDKMEEINDRLHRSTYNKMNLKLKDIKKHVKCLGELSKEVIELIESSIKEKQKITINHKHFFVWNVNKAKMKKNIKNNSKMFKNHINNLKELSDKSEAIRSKAIERVHDINKNPRMIGKPWKGNTYLDSFFKVM